MWGALDTTLNMEGNQMAKYVRELNGDFQRLLDEIHAGILEGSASASYEDGSDYQAADIRCAVRVYERYSMLGGNRVSLNVTLAGNGDRLFLTAITSGGSQAVLFKVNTFGEESFLKCIIDIVNAFQQE